MLFRLSQTETFTFIQLRVLVLIEYTYFINWLTMILVKHLHCKGFS